MSDAMKIETDNKNLRIGDSIQLIWDSKMKQLVRLLPNLTTYYIITLL